MTICSTTNPYRRTAQLAALTVIFAPAALLLICAANAQTYSVLHSFAGGSDGGSPYFSGVILDPQGNLYGSTSFGSLYKISSAGAYSVTYDFSCGTTTGAAPTGTLLRDTVGNLYGNNGPSCGNNGSVFEFDAAGNETTFYTFSASVDAPFADNLIEDAEDNLYGTTYLGSGNYGQVFKVDAAGSFTAIYTFDVYSNGAYPVGGVLSDALGNLYGAASDGGAYGGGAIFKIDTAGNESVLYSLSSVADGSTPNGGLMMDAQGNLYGTAFLNGGSACGYEYGCGTVFKLSPSGQFTVLYAFGQHANDGYSPNGNLIMDAEGNLYGTTYRGGAFSHGTIFELSPTGTETVLHSFNESTDGSEPTVGVATDPQGNLYGTTQNGGTGGFGTVFKLALQATTSTTTTLTSAPNPSAYGQSLTLTAAVTSASGAPPSGETVTFQQGKTVLGTGTLTSGEATLSTAAIGVGTKAISATYSGDSTFKASTSKAISQVVNKATSTTTLRSSPNPSNAGQTVTFTAKVSPQYGGTPTGTVVFMDGTTTLKVVTLSGGAAKYGTAKLATGTHTITANYNGSTDFDESSAALTQTVN
jgi:uncharacterized repeat protein (TIGR03803 family)